MIRLILSILFAISFWGLTHAIVPEVNPLIGKPSMEELEMTKYDPEPSADALILFERREEYMFYGTEGFTIKRKCTSRIKILNEAATHLGDITIPYYAPDSKNKISKITATSYNLINGKIDKTSVDRSLIFHEKLAPGFFLCKFSIPKVIEGSVIEIEYEIDCHTMTFDWEIQGEYPVLRGELDLTLPEFFSFNVTPIGSEHIELEQKVERSSMSMLNQLINCDATIIKASVDRMPSLHDDDYVFAISDYYTKLNVSLIGIQLPRQPYQPLASTWNDLSAHFHNEWNEMKKLKNPYQDQMQSLDFSDCKNICDSVNVCADFVATRLRWNGVYNTNPGNIKKAIEEQSASNAQMNFVLMSILKDLGIKCNPIALCTRSRGVVSAAASMIASSLNTMALTFIDSDNKYHFIDCSDDYRGSDALPIDMLTSFGLIIDIDNQQYHTMTTHNDVSSSRRKIDVEIIDGVAHCVADIALTRQEAAEFQHLYHKSLDHNHFISEVESQFNIDITDLTLQGMKHRSNNVRINAKFDKAVAHTDSVIYINPMIIPEIVSNPFLAETRKVGIEFPYQEESTIVSTIKIPDGYMIDELPSALSIRDTNGELSFTYNISVSDDNIMLICRRKKLSTIFPQNVYNDIRLIYDSMVDKNTDLIVLKKK